MMYWANHRRPASAAGAALLTVATLVPCPLPQAGASPQTPGRAGGSALAQMLRADVSLRAGQAGSAVYAFGEPVFLEHRLTNVADRYAFTWVGFNGEEWFKLTVEDAQGKPVPAREGGETRPPDGLSAMPGGTRGPGQSYSAR